MESSDSVKIERLSRENRRLRESLKHKGFINQDQNTSLDDIGEEHLGTTSQNRDHLRMLVDGIEFPIYMVQPDHSVTMMNRKACEYCTPSLGSDDKMFCRDVFFFCDAENCTADNCSLDKAFAEKKKTTFMVRRDVAGGNRTFQVSISPLTVEKRAESAIVCVVDVTEQVSIENMLAEKRQKIAYMAHHDALTGLHNRYALSGHIEDCIHECSQGPEQFALFFMDIDNFKKVNDVYGHDVGDALLCRFSKYLKNILRSNDFVARFGGDEFVIVTRYEGCEKHLDAVGERLISIKDHIRSVRDYDLRPTVSVGISVYPRDGRTLKELLQNADLAMYVSKAAGGSCFTPYTKDIKGPTRESMSMENALSKAVEQSEFRLYYQSQTNFCTGEVVGAEALLRWVSPSLGVIMPDVFIPIAEAMHLISGIGDWVIRTACKDAMSWKGKLEGKRVSVNVSAQQFFEGNLVESVKVALDDSGLVPRRLELEITESLLMQDPDQAIDIMHRLSGLGVRLSLDDFGTGYSSLASLAQFPMDRLKIDRSFVEYLSSGGTSSAIIRGIIGLAKNMDLEVLAEGIETSGQLEALQGMDCHLGQGFLFSRPLPLEELLEKYGEKLESHT